MGGAVVDRARGASPRRSTLARIRSLSPQQRRTLLEALTALGRARLEVRFRPFRSIVSSIEGPAPRDDRATSSAELHDLETVSWAFRVLGARVPPFGNCLTQAVAAKRLLNRRGIGSTLHLGVAPGPGQAPFEAHAWLEARGRVVIGQTEQTFKVLYSDACAS